LDALRQEVKEHSLAMFTTQLAQSQALLGNRLTLYQVHSVTLDSGLFTDAPLLAALSRLRAEGVIIGLSASGPNQADTIRRALSPARSWIRTWPRSPSTSFRRSASPKPPTTTGRSGRPGHGTELFPLPAARRRDLRPPGTGGTRGPGNRRAGQPARRTSHVPRPGSAPRGAAGPRDSRCGRGSSQPRAGTSSRRTS